MANEGRILEEVGLAASRLSALGRPFALVGGLAVSIRGEVRFTRDVDLAIDVSSDEETDEQPGGDRRRGQYPGRSRGGSPRDQAARDVGAAPADRIDARGLLLANPDLELERVRMQLARIAERGFDRGKDLEANLQAVLAEVASM